MGRSIARAGSVAVVAALALALGPPAQAALPDASCPTTGSPGGFTALVRNAQTFTAVHTGTVASAQFDISQPSVGSGDFQLQILATSAGAPVNGVLGSGTIPNGSVPAGNSTLAATFSTPAPVVAGQQYALVVTRPGGSQYDIKERGGGVCPGNEFTSGSQTGTWAAGESGFAFIFQVFVNPPNAFTVGKLKGRKLHLNVPGPGAITVVDATRGPGAVPAAGGKLLKPSKANAASAGDAVVKLRLTKRGKALLGQRGKLRARAEITFTPTGGEPSTRRTKLKFKR